jgi:hypothetical protein
VTRDLASMLRLFVLPTLALLVIVAFMPGRVEPAVRIYVLVLCTIALGLALAALRRSYPRTTPLRVGAGRRARDRLPPPSLVRLEHEVALGVASGFDLHYRLLPRLRALASGLLLARRRISLDSDPQSARRSLGVEAWGLVSSDRPRPDDRLSRGVPSAELKRAVSSLERL